ncbi:GNAT family N-acetyltransferase [Spirillospora sp. NBC_01491]|uniref:GNAT family N-acetyltransferase n=1 Tax=Spirillospora sp. NBC_01491 TaxID=2976007 RepID=UPI002E2F7BD6|nr:GNAT family protein [Spirillospora sp. NBC_01491]
MVRTGPTRATSRSETLIDRTQQIRLSGQGLVLREWDDADLAAMAELFDDPAVAYWTPLAAPFDLAAAGAYLARLRASAERLHLAITTDGRVPLGEVLLDRTRGTLGYVVGAAHRGQGLAARALRLMTAYAHEGAGLAVVSLEVEPANDASAAVARAAGYTLSGAEPVEVEDKGRTHALLTWTHPASP